MIDRAFIVKEEVQRLSEEASVEVLFHKARRKTDLTRFSLIGERNHVLGLPTLFQEVFEDESIELIEASWENTKYFLTLAITEKLEFQESFITERRQKLVRLTEFLLLDDSDAMGSFSSTDPSTLADPAN